MLLIFEKGIWSGITQANKRYAKVNIKWKSNSKNSNNIVWKSNTILTSQAHIFSIWMQTTDDQWSENYQRIGLHGRK